MASSFKQPAMPPLLEQAQETAADPQEASSFFARLPTEIRRMIYVEVWRTYGAPGVAADTGDTDSPDHSEWWWRTHGGSLNVHIAPVQDTGDGGGFTSAPCFLGVDDDGPDTAVPPEAYDMRLARLVATRARTSSPPRAPQPDDDELPDADVRPRPSSPPPATGVLHSVWQARMDCPWTTHWPCADHFTGSHRTIFTIGTTITGNGAAAAADDDGGPHTDRCCARPPPPLPRRPFLPILLTCRRAHAEAAELLYRALTFQFTDEDTALAFVLRWPAVASVRLILQLGTPGLLAHSNGVGRRRPPPATRGGAAAAAASSSSSAVPQARRYLPKNAWASSAIAASAWHQLQVRLADPVAMPRLRRLRVWAETETPGWPPWHLFAVETRLFAPLLDAAHLLARRAVVLYLPELPATYADRDLPGWCFINEDDDAADDADKEATPPEERPVLRPIVVRTPRPMPF